MKNYSIFNEKEKKWDFYFVDEAETPTGNSRLNPVYSNIAVVVCALLSTVFGPLMYLIALVFAAVSVVALFQPPVKDKK
jgi:hypothetical protein